MPGLLLPGLAEGRAGREAGGVAARGPHSTLSRHSGGGERGAAHAAFCLGLRWPLEGSDWESLQRSQFPLGLATSDSTKLPVWMGLEMRQPIEIPPLNVRGVCQKALGQVMPSKQAPLMLTCRMQKPAVEGRTSGSQQILMYEPEAANGASVSDSLCEPATSSNQNCRRAVGGVSYDKLCVIMCYVAVPFCHFIRALGLHAHCATIVFTYL